jgi:hypothetical protein
MAETGALSVSRWRFALGRGAGLLPVRDLRNPMRHLLAAFNKRSLGPICLCLLFLAACARAPEAAHVNSEPSKTPTAPATIASGTSDTADSSCPPFAQHEGDFAAVAAAHAQPEHWIAQWQKFSDVDVPVLNADELRRHNDAVGRRGAGLVSQADLSRPLQQDLSALVADRLNAFTQRVAQGRYVRRHKHRVDANQLRVLREGSAQAVPVSRVLRVALADIQVRCAPLSEPLFAEDSDETYDRNACSMLRPQEPLEVLAEWPGQLWLVRTAFTFGWITKDAPLSPPIPEKWARSFVRGARLWAREPVSLNGVNGASVRLPQFAKAVRGSRHNEVILATESGFFHAEATAPNALLPDDRPLTRRAFLETAFQYLDTPYGWGGMNGGRDCSDLVADLFGAFGLALPRTSGWQVQAGAFRISTASATPSEKTAWFDEALKSGLVLLYFPGHIMVYLGRSETGAPMVLHSLGEYASPCAGGEGETVRRVQRVVVTDMTLGQGSSRTSLLERVTDIVVFGARPPASLPGAFSLRRTAPASPQPPALCQHDNALRIFVSPRRPVMGAPVRVIAVGDNGERPAEIAIWRPDGSPVPVTTRYLPGIPGGWVATFTPDHHQRWRAALLDGDHVYACRPFGVLRGMPRLPARAEGAPYWRHRLRWEQDTENYFSLFVRHLFDYPLDDDRTWNNLQDLLGDETRNLLYNHFGQDEDIALSLKPDCADLPFVLRAYFAWKNALPFAVRSCSRGRPGRPPSCGDLYRANEFPFLPREPQQNTDIDAFAHFAAVDVSWTVHSGATRTHPAADATDLYPIPLERRWLSPGAVYADPYGHVLMIIEWIPQKPGADGVLLAVDGQPDTTIGRRRFWPGSFLFDPRTEDVGAGFKRFRPLVRRPKDASPPPPEEALSVVALENRDLRRHRDFAPFDLSQYALSVADFYRVVEHLIQPMPRPASQVVQGRVDAFEEAVQRRVLAVELGRRYRERTDGRVIDMPEGHDIFETTGPWEDFASPSRDMRLLLAIDDIVGLPERWASAAGDTPDAAEMAALLQRDLQRRTVAYTTSDGAAHWISLADVVARQKALEVGYNPNDCPEVRWGADASSAEGRGCRYRAPDAQRERMEEYRTWFQTRQRPPRG